MTDYLYIVVSGCAVESRDAHGPESSCVNTLFFNYCIDLRGKSMCDVKKYSDIYKEIAKLNPKDTLQLVLESETEEEKDFYEMVGDFLLQRRQKEVVERNPF